MQQTKSVRSCLGQITWPTDKWGAKSCDEPLSKSPAGFTQSMLNNVLFEWWGGRSPGLSLSVNPPLRQPINGPGCQPGDCRDPCVDNKIDVKTSNANEAVFRRSPLSNAFGDE